MSKSSSKKKKKEVIERKKGFPFYCEECKKHLRSNQLIEIKGEVNNWLACKDCQTIVSG